MLKKEELIEYRNKLENELTAKCEVLVAQQGVKVHNAENTSDRRAPHGVSWIDYWRALTGRSESQLMCASCGKIIFAGEIPKVIRNLYAITNDSPEAHQALGGHISITPSDKENYYITPLCPECNSRMGAELILRTGTLICKEYNPE